MKYTIRIAAVVALVMACDKPDNASSSAVDTLSQTTNAGDTSMMANPGTAPAGDAAKIAEAASAAPDSIGKMATVMDWPAAEGAEPRQLRTGTNGWVCYPSTPGANAVGQDPMCLDPVFQKWAGAYMSKTTPNISGAGFAYMLKGDRGASNTDPFAKDSTASNHWVRVGAHVMMVAPTQVLASVSATPGPTPWVMWKGTPYAHVMMPVQ